MLAAASGNVEAVKRLIDGGAEVNAKEPVRGLTPVMFAAASNRAAVLALLAKNGADLKATSKVTDLAGAEQGSGGAARVHVRQPGAARRAAGRRTQRPGAAGGRAGGRGGRGNADRRASIATIS